MAEAKREVTLHLDGAPRTRKEPLLGRHGPYPHPKTKADHQAWQAEWLLSRTRRFEGPVAIEVYVRCERPPSHFLYGRSDLNATGKKHPYPPSFDVDNVLKCLLDALKGVAFGDDSLVVSVHAQKRYVNASSPHKVGTEATIRSALPDTL